HRRLERGEFRHRHVEGHLARRQPLLSSLSLPVVPAHAARGRARPLRLPQDIAGGGGQGARPPPAPPISRPPQRPEAGNFSFSTGSSSSPTRPSRRRGIAALISSTVRAIARSAIAPAIASAASSRASALPADPIRKAVTAGSPTSRRQELATTRSGTS